MDFQPIESAPKDRPILARTTAGPWPVLVAWDPREEGFAVVDDEGVLIEIAAGLMGDVRFAVIMLKNPTEWAEAPKREAE